MDAREFHAPERLLDGRPVLIRAIRPDDKEALREGFLRLSPHSVFLRFFHSKKELTTEDLAYLTEVDFERHVALVATLEEEGEERGVGVGRYITEGTEEARVPPGCAEVAFVVDEEHRGLGVATLLLKHLAAIARSQGLKELHAFVLPENRPMLEVFEHSGLPSWSRLQDGVLRVRLFL